MVQRYTVLACLDQRGVFADNGPASTSLRVIHDLRLSATSSGAQAAATTKWT
jgi:hypothetical protein